MANYYTSAHLLETKAKGRRRFQGVLKYQTDNPDYVPDTRADNQRRKAMGRRANPDYVPDERMPNQRARTVTKTVRRVFDAEAARAILNDHTATAPRTKTEARRILNAWHEQMEAEHATPDASKTVAEYVADYITTRERQGRLEESTLHDYRRTAKYLDYGEGASIGGIVMRELTPRQVQAWESALFECGLSGTTCLKAHRLLKQVCKYAVEIDDLPKSPVRGFDAPSRSTGKPNALDADGRRQAMLALGSMEPTPVTIAAELALYTGMRRGEICALTWADVDLDGVEWSSTNERGPKLRVTRSLGDAAGGSYLKEPKTEKGRRVIPLGGGIVDTLKTRRARMWAEWADAMQEAGHMPKEATFSTLYVIGWTNGDYYDPDTLTKQWRELAKQIGLVGTQGRTPTLHDLRHSAATMLITRGVDVATVSAILGHEQISTTLDMYTSSDNAAKRGAVMVAAADLDTARAGDVLPFVPRTGTEG